MDVNGRLNEKLTRYKVVLGVVIIKAFVHSISSIYGLLFESFFESFKASKLDIATVMNLNVAFSNFSGIVAGFLVKSVSSRNVAILGSFCVSFGLISTTLVTSFHAMLLTYSVIVGIGSGLVILACFIAIIDNFPTGKNKAVGISMTGGLIGEILLPQVVGFLLLKSDFKITVIIVGLLILLSTSGAFLIPKKNRKNVEFSEETKLLIPRKQEKVSMIKIILKSTDVEIFKDYKFLILIIGMSVEHAVSADFGMIYPSFLKVFINYELSNK